MHVHVTEVYNIYTQASMDYKYAICVAGHCMQPVINLQINIVTEVDNILRRTIRA